MAAVLVCKHLRGRVAVEALVALAAAGVFWGASSTAQADNTATIGAPPPPTSIIAVDLSVSGGYPNLRLKQFMLSFQGIVNRGQPRLFVIDSPEDYYWLGRLEQDYGISATILASPWDVFDNAALTALCHQVIVYSDQDVGLAENAAVTMAGEYGTAVAKIQDAHPTDLTDILAKGFTIHTDLRGTFSSNEQVNLWTFQNCRSATNPHVIAISAGALTGRNKGIDYMAQQNMMVWCLDAKPQFLTDYNTTQRDILASYSPTMAYGFWVTEGKDVAALSRYGHWEVGHGGNISVYSQLPPRTGEAQRTTVALPPYEAGKKYVLFSFSQGDACDFCQTWNLDNLQAESAAVPGARVCERYPFGLFQGTPTGDLQPNVVRGCYALKTDNQFFTGKPLGYNDPTVMDQYGFLDPWLAWSKPYLAKMGYPDCMINDSGTESDPSHAVMNKICAQVRPRSVLFKHQLHPAAAEDDPPEYIADVPVFGDPVFARDSAGGDPDFDVAATKQAVLTSAAKRQFFWVFLDHTDTAGRLEQLLDSLAATNPEIVPLSTDRFVRLYIQTFPPYPNAAPSFNTHPFTKPAAAAGHPYNQSMASDAGDPDAGDTLTFSKVDGPAWLSVASGGALTGTPGAGDVGANVFTVRVTDALGLLDDAGMNISVVSAPSSAARMWKRY